MLPLCHQCGLRFKGFKFPVIEKKRTLWLRSLGFPDPKKYGASGLTICYSHFEPKDMKITKKGLRLTDNAVPRPVVGKVIGPTENVYIVASEGMDSSVFQFQQ